MEASPIAGHFHAVSYSRPSDDSLLLMVHITPSCPHDSSNILWSQENIFKQAVNKATIPTTKGKKLSVTQDGIPFFHC